MTNKIIIIGTGVVGASTALTLLKDGHNVTLVHQHLGMTLAAISPNRPNRFNTL